MDYSLIIMCGTAGVGDDEDLPQHVRQWGDHGAGGRAVPAAGAEQHPGGGQCPQHAAGRLHQHEHQKGHRPRVDTDAGEMQVLARLGGC